MADGLHNKDDAAFAFTKTLIDRLETTKTERADDDAIVDNEAGQAYVEQFAQETFDRAERTMKADKVTRQTADTFDAAATFFDLGSEWGPLDPEVLQKIKFAKWNAARILKAIREGKDPNESNPKVKEEEATEGPALDPDDPEVRELTGISPQPAAVEDVPDAGEPTSTAPQLQEPSPDAASHEGYFPPALTNAPDAFAPSPISPDPAQPAAPGSHYEQPPPSAPVPDIPAFTPQAPSPYTDPSAPPSWTTTPSAPAQPPPVQQPTVPAWSPAPVSGPGQKNIDKAQKHAKFAVSALNFDDVTTAVLELRTALAALGAQ